MKCPSCQAPISPGAKFCPECGTRISQICSCGAQLTGNEKFCPECGNPTAGSSSSSQASTPYKSGVQSSTSGYSMGMDKTMVGQSPSLQQIFLNPGDKIGNYCIKGKLGQGGFGRVYRATEELLEEDHALKVMPLISRDFVKNILLEFKSRDKIKSFDNIIKAWQPQPAVYQGQDILLYPMELANMTFRQWLNEHKGRTEVIMNQGLEIFKQACLGLEAIHNAGLTHLDIKPENILLIRYTSREGEWIAKIADFGLARGVGMETLSSLEDGMGTPAYMAPEQIMAARWKDVGREADIYALGMILYEMIDGDLPYSGTPKQIKEKKRDTSILIAPLKIQSTISKVAMQCLNRVPNDRPSNIGSILAQLDIVNPNLINPKIEKNNDPNYEEEKNASGLNTSKQNNKADNKPQKSKGRVKPNTLLDEGKISIERDSNSKLFFNSLTDAINNCENGDVIRIKPGKYYEGSIEIDSDLDIEIRGEGNAPDIVVFAKDSNKILEPILRISGNFVISNLTLVTDSINWGVIQTITVQEEARLELYDCEIQGGIQIKGKAKSVGCNFIGGTMLVSQETGQLEMEYCSIHHGEGLAIQMGGEVHLIGCEIFSNKSTGIMISDSSYVYADSCSITQNEIGIWANESARGDFLNCDFRGNVRGSAVKRPGSYINGSNNLND